MSAQNGAQSTSVSNQILVFENRTVREDGNIRIGKKQRDDKIDFAFWKKSVYFVFLCKSY